MRRAPVVSCEPGNFSFILPCMYMQFLSWGPAAICDALCGMGNGLNASPIWKVTPTHASRAASIPLGVSPGYYSRGGADGGIRTRIVPESRSGPLPCVRLSVACPYIHPHIGGDAAPSSTGVCLRRGLPLLSFQRHPWRFIAAPPNVGEEETPAGCWNRTRSVSRYCLHHPRRVYS